MGVGVVVVGVWVAGERAYFCVYLLYGCVLVWGVHVVWGVCVVCECGVYGCV